MLVAFASAGRELELCCQWAIRAGSLGMSCCLLQAASSTASNVLTPGTEACLGPPPFYAGWCPELKHLHEEVLS